MDQPPRRYRVEVRPSLDEIGRFRFTLVSHDGLHRVDSEGSFDSRETAQRIGDLQAFELGQIGGSEE